MIKLISENERQYKGKVAKRINLQMFPDSENETETSLTRVIRETTSLKLRMKLSMRSPRDQTMRPKRVTGHRMPKCAFESYKKI